MGNKKPSILFITMGVNEGSSRFRVQQYIPYLKKDGYYSVVYPLHWGSKHPNNYGILNFFWLFQIILLKIFSLILIPFFDIIFLQRGVIKKISPHMEKIAAALNNNIIFDFDDAIWLNYSNTRIKPVAEVIKISKMIIAGNKILHDYANQFNNNVIVIPTPINTDLYKPKERAVEKNYLAIGWIGTFSNLKYLQGLQDVFIRLSEKYGLKIKLIIVCDKKPDFELGIVHDFILWTAENEVKDIQSFDIGIMPLDDNDWTRGKCAFKVIQYMSVGVPIVASPVGANKDVILQGTGYLASTTEEWFNTLCRLIDNEELRKEMVTKARAEIIKNYSVQANYKKISAVINRYV